MIELEYNITVDVIGSSLLELCSLRECFGPQPGKNSTDSNSLIPFVVFFFFLLDNESPTSANLGNDHEFINKKYSLH